MYKISETEKNRNELVVKTHFKKLTLLTGGC